jgi:hypothetical protein
METATVGVIFIAVWLGVVFLYCIFRACGGRVVDILSCDCCAGPLFDCWGAGGQIDKYDREYPFSEHEQYRPYNSQNPQMPPIIVVNSARDKAYRRREDDEEYTSSEDEARGYRKRSRPGRPKRVVAPRDPEQREEAGGALLLRSSNMDTDPVKNEPVFV